MSENGSNHGQWLLVGGVVLLLAALLGAGWVVRDRFMPVDVGSSAPQVTATDLAGKPVDLASLRGQVVLLNIWATWCPPCRAEMPSMERLYRTLGPEGLHIVAVSIDAAEGKTDADGREGGDVAAFTREYGLTFPVWRQPSGEIGRAYRTTGVPESFLIDRKGRIVKKVIGATEWDSPDNVDLVRRLLKE
ncbi:MAG TPA: TlpA disulfide reductase family protein [Longimicrobium sp.]|nr:TlpA disulfide reductase family protein [Longimicrobium sp.]